MTFSGHDDSTINIVLGLLLLLLYTVITECATPDHIFMHVQFSSGVII